MPYKLVYKRDHPNARSNGQIKRSRLVMSEHLGRPLLETELVHHLNGDKSDDRIENLVIISRSKHAAVHHSGEKNNNWNQNASYKLPKVCPNCGTEFLHDPGNQARDRCCSNKCRAEFYKGERGCRTKITQETADKIRTLRGLLSSRKIAAVFNLSPTHIKRILKGDIW